MPTDTEQLCYNPSKSFLLWPSVVPSHACAGQCSDEFSRRTLYRSADFFPMQLLFSSTLSCKFLTSVLPNFSSHSLFGHTLLHMGSQFPNREWNRAPALEAQSLNCCTPTEVPQRCLCSLGSQLSSCWAPPSCATA